MTSIQEKIPKTRNEKILEAVIELKQKEKFLKEVRKAKVENQTQSKAVTKIDRTNFQQNLFDELDKLDNKEQANLIIQKIEEIKKQIDSLGEPGQPVNGKELKRLRSELEVYFIAKKHYKIKGNSQINGSRNDKYENGWKEWINQLGYKID